MYARVGINRFRIRAGRAPETHAILRDALQATEYVALVYVAELYAQLGDDDEAFVWLEKALEDGGWLIPGKRIPVGSAIVSLVTPLRSSLSRAGLPPRLTSFLA